VGPVDLGLMLLLGLTSSLHCAAMCGPLLLVAMAPVTLGRDRGAWARRGRWQLGYHLGRAVTYVLLGAILATAGVVVARWAGGAVELLVGLAIVAAGLVELCGRAGSVAAAESTLVRVLRSLVTSRRGAGVFVLGLVTGVFPCGVLYVAFARSLAAGSAWGGAAGMLAFWLGTVPLLAGLGFTSGPLLRAAGRHATVLLCCAMLGTGGWLAYRGALTLGRPASGCPLHSAR
jgi:uncharacterized protein